MTRLDLLAVDGLSVRARSTDGRSDVTILDGVHLRVRAGEVVAVIGASGSGKSTLGLAALGYARPGARIVAGRVCFEGRDLLALPRRDLRLLRGTAIAYVPQSAAAAFNPALSIDRQVIEAPVSRLGTRPGLALEAARALYALLGLPDVDHIGRRYPHQVSGGQLQRLAAAMALAGGPRLVIFDEPTTALDVTTQVGVLRAFRDAIAASGVGAVYISHDTAVVAQLAHRIVVLEAGRVIDEGEPQSILASRRRATPPVSVSPRPAPREPLLAMRGVTARYTGARAPALVDVDLTIGRAEIVGIVGESGSGKSTLARVVAGLLAPERGALHLDGRPLAALAQQRPREALRQVQIAFQSADVALNPRQRVREILGRPLSLFSVPRGSAREERVRALLTAVELPPDFADRYPYALSGGQKQRVNLARALAAEPSLVVCDEVTSALDAPIRAQIVALLRRIRDERGLALVFITHDLSTVAGFADRVVVLYRGRVVEEGPAGAVIARPLHPYTQELVRSIPQPDRGWLDRAAARPMGEQNAHGDRGCPFVTRCPSQIAGVCERAMPKLASHAGRRWAACHALPLANTEGTFDAGGTAVHPDFACRFARLAHEFD